MPFKTFQKEFNTLSYSIKNAKKILLFAHTRPDPDACGSVVGFKRYIEENYNADVTIGCYNEQPEFLDKILGKNEFIHPNDLKYSKFDLAVGCDSVERGFESIIDRLEKKCVIAAIDHHHDITMEVDINIVDADFSSTSEILYHFAKFERLILSQFVAISYMTGIIGDTGIFQHSNTSSRTLAASADLVKHGANVSRIVNTTFSNQKIKTLNAWGGALENAKLFKKEGLIVTAVTTEDLQGRNLTGEEVKEVASILSTVPGVKASLFLFQIGENRIRGNIRAPSNTDVDVSKIARMFGGGGHKLASGFEINGKIVTLKGGGWKVV